MEKLKPRTLSGFMELLPAPQQKFERMLEILRKNFALYGFTPIDTPIIESAEILLAKGGGETEKQIYRFQKGDSDLALRFDHTVPLANTSPCMRMSSASRSGAMPLARSTAASAPSAAASANSIRPISTSSATASSPSSTRRKFRPLFIRYSRSSA